MLKKVILGPKRPSLVEVVLKIEILVEHALLSTLHTGIITRNEMGVKLPNIIFYQTLSMYPYPT